MFAVVVGGAGALGRELITKLRLAQTTINIDFVANEQAHHNILASSSFGQLHEQVKALGGDQLIAIYAVAGGWDGGNATADGNGDESHPVALDESLDRLWRQNVHSAMLACHLATLLNSSGVLCLTSAKASLSACPTMLAYGVCKVAVNQMVKAMTAAGSGLPPGAIACAILP